MATKQQRTAATIKALEQLAAANAQDGDEQGAAAARTEIEQIKRQAAADRIAASTAEAKTTKPVKPTAKPQPAAAKATTTPAANALPKLPRLPRKPKPGQPCGCGCGTTTRGGRFVPGHDARLYAWAMRVERKLIKLAEVPDVHRAAVKALLAAGWVSHTNGTKA